MIFLLLFVVGGMTIPMFLDSKKNPDNNIIKRAWQDIKQYKKDFFEKK